MPGLQSAIVNFTWVLYEVSAVIVLKLYVSAHFKIVQVSFAMAFLVTVVVTFVLIPGGKRQGLPTANFFKPLPVLMQ